MEQVGSLRRKVCGLGCVGQHPPMGLLGFLERRGQAAWVGGLASDGERSGSGGGDFGFD